MIDTTYSNGWQLRIKSCFFFFALLALLTFSCRQTTEDTQETAVNTQKSIQSLTPLDKYVATPDEAFEYKIVDTIAGEGHSTYVIRMVSQRWLTEAEVKDPVWWHWLTLVVPDEVQSDKGLLFIGGGSRKSEQPQAADPQILPIAMASKTVVASLHNIPNQTTEFVGDDYGPRVEDELIAYGWRQFLEGGAKEEDAKWLARLPMTKAAVRAMDVITEVSGNLLESPVDQFVVAGGSKRGWTTWTTAAVDDRVIAIVPIVIDMLNAVPSFQHHWRAYGFWAPAVGNYVEEGIMEWQGSQEYQQLLGWVEPFSYRDRLDMPKLLINASGDQFFLPDSWQFYWDSLQGESHLRYVANGDHSLRDTDALESLISFYQSIVLEKARPEFDWLVENGEIVIQVHPDNQPTAVKLWQAHNPEARDFRLETIGPVWEAKEIPMNNDGSYRLKLETPEKGYAAFFGELSFDGSAGIPLKLSTGVVVTPDVYMHEPYVSPDPKGTPLGGGK